MSCLASPDDPMTDAEYDKAHREYERACRLIAAPLSRVRALAVAAIVVRGLMDEGEPVGIKTDYAQQMVRTMMAIARRQASVPPATVEECRLLNAATATVHRLVVQDCHRKGLSIARRLPARKAS